MTESDKQFVDAVNRWRKESPIHDEIINFLDELENAINDDCFSDMFDDGFDACSIMVSRRIRGIINAKRD